MKQLKAAMTIANRTLCTSTLSGFSALVHSFTAHNLSNQLKEQASTLVPGRMPLKTCLTVLGFVDEWIGTRGSRIDYAQQTLGLMPLASLLPSRVLRRRLPFGYPLEPRHTDRLFDFSFIQTFSV